MNQFLNAFKYHLINSYLYLIETIYDLYKLIISIVLLVTIPIWYVPVVVFIKLVEPSIKRKQEEETEKVIDRMFPNEKSTTLWNLKTEWLPYMK